MSFTAGYKVNEGTFWEFTVSDETIQEIVSGGGIAESDLTDYCYTALFDSRVKKLLSPMENPPWTPDWESWVQANCTCYLTNRGTMPNTAPAFNLSLLDGSDDVVYQRNFLVWSGTIYPDTPNAKTGLFLVMDMFDIKRWYCDFSNAGFGTTTVTSSDLSEYQCDWPGYTGPAYTYMSNNYNFPVISAVDPTPGIKESLSVCNVLNVNEELWIGGYNPSTHGASTIGGCRVPYVYQQSQYRDGGYLESGATPDTLKIYQKGTVNLGAVPDYSNTPDYPDCPFQWAANLPFETWLEVLNDDMLLQMYGNWGQQNYSSSVYTYTYSYTKTLNGILKWMAWCGLKFYYNSTYYKPIIENGIITGFSDDMDAPSEWDNMTNVTGNNISPTPPAPGPSGGDEDNKDPITTTGAPFSAGLCNYYALTAGSVLLDHISEALGTWDIENTHKDLYKNLVSCKLIKPPAAIPTTGSAPFTIYGVKPQYEGADITLPVVTGNPEATFGPYTIDRKFGDFRDYAPYTRVSIFLPYCGWCDLPSHVVGRQVTVKYFTDIIAATCKAVVFCGNNIVAEAAGVIGLDIPFVADNVGAKMQAVTAGMISALGGGIQLGAGIGTMVSTKSGSGAKAALSGASQYLSGYSQMAMAFNENTTEISGKNGDGCCLAGATNILIKIVRPKKGAYTTAPFTPPGYGHNVGFVSQKQVKVSSVSGLLIADNVDTSGISGATEAERTEIKRVLETGLIVNAAPE